MVERRTRSARLHDGVVDELRTLVLTAEVAAVSGGGRRYLRWAAAAAIALAVPSLAFVVGQRTKSADQAAAEAGPPEPTIVTAVVERQVLAEEIRIRGSVARSETVGFTPVAPPDGAHTVITAISLNAGDTVVEGDLLLVVANRPVFIFEGQIQSFRDLVPGDEGADVAQLQRALVRVGHAIDVDGVYGSETKAAVASLFTEAGFPAPQALPNQGELLAESQTRVAIAEASKALAVAALQEAGRVDPVGVASAGAALEQAKREAALARSIAEIANGEADDAVSAAEQALAARRSDPDSTSGEIVQAEADLTHAIAMQDLIAEQQDALIAAADDQVRITEAALSAARRKPDIAGAEAALAAAERECQLAHGDHATLLASSGAMLRRSEVVFLPSLPTTIVASRATLGLDADDTPDPESENMPLMEFGSLGLMVEATVSASERLLLDDTVEISVIPDVTGRPMTAAISSIRQANSQLAAGTYILTLEVNGNLDPTLVNTGVSVVVQRSTTEAEGLVVPVAGVWSNSSGSTFVTVQEDGTAREVAVTVGVTVDGLVEIIPNIEGQVVEGDRVVIGVGILPGT